MQLHTYTSLIIFSIIGTLLAQNNSNATTSGNTTASAPTTVGDVTTPAATTIANAATPTATTMGSTTTSTATTIANETTTAATTIANATTPTATTMGSTTTSTTTTTTTTERTWPRPHCGNPRLNDVERGIFLDMHNNYRGSLVKGQTQVNAGWGIAPPATVIYRMKYDCGAESYAQQAVSTCRQTSLPPYALGAHKQNIHIVTSSTTRFGAIQNAVHTWWSQLSRHGFRSNMLYLPSDNTRERPISSWTKMAWWNNLRVGCAIQHCGPVYVISCMYSPGGNYDYAYVYRVGAVCSECGSGCDEQSLCRW